MQSNSINKNIKESGLWALMLVVTAGAFYLTYGYDFSSPILAIVWIVWLLMLGGLAFYTTIGQTIFLFSKESKIELQKVVWPNRQETIQTTLIVMMMVGLTGIMLWVFDLFILWGIAKLTHLG